MKEINQYEGFITSADMYQCILLACNDFASKEMLEIGKTLEIDENQDFYTISKIVFFYMNTLEDYYLSLTEGNQQFLNRVFVKSKENRLLCKKYEEKLIEINQTKKQFSDNLGKASQEELLDQFVSSTFSFFHMVKEDFSNGDFKEEVCQYDDGAFFILLPMINAAYRNCDFYRKEILKREENGIKTEWSISLTSKQKEEINTKMKMKVLTTINDNLEGLFVAKENYECQEKTDAKIKN